MSDPLDQLKNDWNEAKSTSKQGATASEIIVSAQKKMKSVTYSHYGNILVLTLTLIMISAFFYYITPFQDLLSKIGVALMVGGLAIRIFIELYSAGRSKQIDLSETTSNMNSASLAFYQYRKRIHGPVTITILAAYSIGFYMLSPEFSKYFTTTQMILMDGSYVVIAVVLIYVIRKGISDEMRQLKEVTELDGEFAA